MAFVFPRAFLLLLATGAGSFGAPRVLLTKPVHLGVAGAPEWAEFASDKNPPSRIDLAFDAEPNATEGTLFIRQREVKQEWIVELNSRRIGKLFLMETALVQTLPVPAGILKATGNTLAIFRAGTGLADDIVIEEVTLDSRTKADTRAAATLAIVASQENDADLPCRITIMDNRGSLAAIWDAQENVGATPLPLAIRPGVVYTAAGRARVAVAPGDYTVVASRGFEWSVARQQITVASGATANVSLRLQREVSTPNLVACDTHIHTFTF
ncbi:MAG TPA: hypothetical protein VFV83_00425, partial [Chthoniobacteraceae bacterium]|nr:hypothetical protein [Chthoniobacteraceae bacterium]